VFAISLNKLLAYILTFCCLWTAFFAFVRQRIQHEMGTFCCGTKRDATQPAQQTPISQEDSGFTTTEHIY
jgi:hypothetical protein